jgi:cold shock CspA family protein
VNSVSAMDQKLIRIGVFYDGNFFLHVSNYYLYHHERSSRISIDGLHTFIKHKVAESEGVAPEYCSIVDAHYFRGRLPSKIAEERNRLLGERVFEDILLRQNITTHYLPMTAAGEKGIDVWLALETYELAVYKQFNVVVLIAGDGDFLPLVRKLNTLGTRVMLLAWDFRYTGENGEERETKSAQVLLNEATYPVLVSNLVDDRTSVNDPLVNNLFLPASAMAPRPARPAPTENAPVDDGELYEGTIKKLKEGYGFIQAPQVEGDIFFYHTDLLDIDLADLQEGDLVEFRMGSNSKGVTAKEIRLRE